MSGSQPFFHAHTHSEYSVLDGMPKVENLVAKAAQLGQPAIGLTDHGNMSGAIELYKAAKNHGIKAFPGEEFYIVQGVDDKDAPRFHVTMLALDDQGYEALVRLSSLSHQRDRYHYKPRIDLTDLARLHQSGDSKHIALLTGCFSGNLVQMATWTGKYRPDDRAPLADIDIRKRLSRAILDTFKNWFPHVFVEFMQHGARFRKSANDWSIIQFLWDLTEQGTKDDIIITQDAHYLHSNEKELHDLMKKMAYHGDDEATFSGDSYHLASRTYMKGLFENDPKIWEAAQPSYQKLLDLHDLTIPAADRYKYHVPHKGKEAWLRSKCERALKGLLKEVPEPGKKRNYQNRLDTELQVIEDQGMAGYFYMIWRGVQYANKHNIYVNARGSANGSLVCFLLGITQVDPIKWNLLFERFLSTDRKKPPDIDLDIEDGKRADIVSFYQNSYKEVVQLGTFQSLGVNEFTGGGSVLVSYLAYRRRKMTPERFSATYGHVKTMDDLVDQDERELLEALAEYKVRKSAGAHAAGFAIGTDDQPIDGLIPLMLIPSSSTMVTQYTMDTVESLGFVKIDLLGQRTLTTIKQCLRNIGLDPTDGLDWIPNNDSATLRDLRRGQSETGVFQFEGWAAAKGCRELAVRSTKDCIHVMALYRPATMQSGYTDMFLRNRRNKKNIEYVHPIFQKHLRETHGVAIYQEQVMSILRDIGVPYDELNQFLSALKMSNDKAAKAQAIFKRQRKAFIQYAMTNARMTKNDAQVAWADVSGFAGYGFNRAHATAYGLLGYRAAYLHTHYPLEYMAAVLETTAGTPKEKVYVKEARRLGIKIRTADVNRSRVKWTIERDAIRKGLTSVSGVGERAAADIVKNAPYDDIQQLIDMTTSRLVTGGKEWEKNGTLKGVMLKLKEGGALKSLGLDPWE